MEPARELQPVRPDEQSVMLHPELLAHEDPDAIYRAGHRLDHAEGASKPLRGHPEEQPRGAKVHGNRYRSGGGVRTLHCRA